MVRVNRHKGGVERAAMRRGRANAMSIEQPSSMDGLSDLGRIESAVLRELPGTAVYVFDRDLRFVLGAGAALAEQGWSTERLVGRLLADAVPAETFGRLEPHYRAALDGETCTLDHQPADSAPWYRIDVGPVRAEDAQVVGGFVVARDITEQRRDRAGARGSRAYLQDILDSLNVPVSVKDADYRFVLFNTEYERLQQIERADLEGKTVFDLYPDEFAEPFHRDDRRVMETGAVMRNERPVPRPDGSIRTYSMVRSPLRDSAGRVYGLIGIGTDITDQRQEASVLHEAHERFEQIFQNAAIGMAVVALDGRLTKVNRALCAFTGYTESSLLGRTFPDITHPDDLEADVAQLQRLLAGHISTYEMEKRYVRADGGIVWALLSVALVRTAQGEPVEFVGQVQDISERRELERWLRRRADHDALTGLRNRARFQDDLEQQIARCRRYGEAAALLVIDLDGFKSLNDEHGHAVGDDALRHVASALAACVRESDIVARWGGDEFVILAPRIAAADARTLATEIGRRLEASPLRIGGRPTAVSASVGVAELGDGTLNADEVLALADASMYEAKRAAHDGG